MNLNYSSYVLAQGDRDFSTFSLFSLNIALWWGRTAPWGEKIRRLFFFFLPPLHSHGFPHIEKLICEQKTSQLQNSVHHKKNYNQILCLACQHGNPRRARCLRRSFEIWPEMPSTNNSQYTRSGRTRPLQFGRLHLSSSSSTIPIPCIGCWR